MAPQNAALKKLQVCMKGANTQAERDACQATFEKSQGATTDGGKVFGTADGNGVFVTDSGKVFTGGKVF